MKKKEYIRDKERIEKKAANSKKKGIQDEADSKVKDSDRNPNAKEDFEKVLRALVPPIKYVKKADRPKKD